MRFILLLSSVLCVAGTPNGKAIVELGVRRHAALSALDRLEAALSNTDASAIVLRLASEGSEEADEDGRLLSSLLPRERVELLRREARVRHSLKASRIPVIAIADGPISGASAALFSAAKRRVCTERTTYALRECREGRQSPAFGALDALASLPQPHVAMAVALGAIKLGPHDCMELTVATHFAATEALPDLMRELRASPVDYYDVPFSRRAARLPPSYLVPLFAAEMSGPLNIALEACFGAHVLDVLDVRVRLAARQQLACSHVCALTEDPTGIHIRTRERAATVCDTLSAASTALADSSPHALAATFVAFRAALARQQRIQGPSWQCKSRLLRSSSDTRGLQT